MRQVVLLCLVFACIFSGAYSQDKNLFKKTFLDAEYFFLTGEYREAVHHYEDLLKIDPDNANVNFLVAACYLSIYGEKEKAIPHLERAVEDMSPGYREGSYKERSAPRETLFALARAYHIIERYDEAIRYYEQYRDVMIKKHFADVEYVNHQIKSCERAKSMMKRPVDVQYLRLSDDVNRFPSNYNPVVSYDDSTLIYITDRPLYRAVMMSRRMSGGGWTEPRVINDEIGSDGEVIPTSLTANGRELYLVRQDAYGSDIYVSSFKNGRWTKMIPLSRKINTSYAETHACISYDGKTLYFTSDRPGGQGALDIWVSEITGDGDWGEPRNLGPKINSHYSEETPFLAELGRKLYFSSQGHATMGGFDYFVAERLPTLRVSNDTEAGSRKGDFDAGWSFPENLGYPISTADDDLFYYPRNRGQGAYCSAIIEEISPTRSIYTIRIKTGQAEIAAVKQGQERIPPELLKTTPDSLAGISGEEFAAETVSPESAVSGSGEGVPGGESQALPPGTTHPDEYFVLNSILFGFDSDELSDTAREEADRIVEVLREYPEISLELTGHSDAVGSDAYNLRLSERRAQSVADYLISKGIRRERIKVTAAGETRPIAINIYEDGTDSPEGRRLNRHVSIRLENLLSDRVRVENVFVPERLRPNAELSFSVLLVKSETMLDTIPDTVAGEQTALIITDSAFLYTAGNFDQKFEAMRYLNEVIDAGYPDAGMLEQRDLERLIARLSEEGMAVTASFSIQIMALRNPVRTSHFKPLEPVTMYSGKDGFHRYVYGEFDSIRKALDRLPSIRKMGYDDAFIMSVLRYRKLSE